jgi:16S rRNA processing protein RimM
VVRFDGVITMDEAESLRGLELRIPEDALRPLDPDRYYVHDLVGCRVEAIGGARIGVVSRVELSTGTPLLVVEGRDAEILVPLAEAICRRIDVAAKIVAIDPPGGLVELNETKRTGRSGTGVVDDDD